MTNREQVSLVIASTGLFCVMCMEAIRPNTRFVVAASTHVRPARKGKLQDRGVYCGNCVREALGDES